jgi:hypothetical protein
VRLFFQQNLLVAGNPFRKIGWVFENGIKRQNHDGIGASQNSRHRFGLGA